MSSGRDGEPERPDDAGREPRRGEPAGEAEARRFELRTGGALRGALGGLLIDGPAAETAAGDAAAEAFPVSIGPYRVLRRLGEGGMGTVFLAQQTEPVRRRVAVKRMRTGLPDRHALLRFEAERQALARMSHPNIAQVYDAGTTTDGAPFTVLEYVDGETITDYCDARGLGLVERIELFEAVCQGVQHAHEKGVLHLDLKPSNILVHELQGKPVPKVIDFGIAKSLAAPLTGAGELPGQLALGTPTYMSPEALTAGESGPTVDTRSDIYALGLVLYEILAGNLPDPRDLALVELVKRRLENDPPAPSRRLARLPPEEAESLAARRGTTLGALGRRLRGDLDAIVLKAIEREPRRRYDSAAALAQDLACARQYEPVSAGPRNGLYGTVKFARRNRVAVAAGLMVALALLLGAGAATLSALRATHQAEVARSAEGEAEAVATFMVDLFRTSDPWSSGDAQATSDTLLAEGARRAHEELAGQPRIQARLLATLGDIYLGQGRYREAEPLVERSIALYRDLDGEDSVAVSSGLLALGRLRHGQGRFELAEESLLRALEIRRRRLGREHPQVAEVLYNLGWVAFERGLYERAEPLFREALEIREAHLPADSLDLAPSLTGLAGLYLYLGRLDEAEPLFRRALDIRRSALGEDHPSVATGLNNLGKLEVAKGNLDAAEALARRALEIDRKALGGDHPYVAMDLANLGEVLWRQGRLDDAEDRLLASLELRRRVLGDDHPSLAFIYHGLARVYRDRGQLERASELFARALTLRERYLVPGNRDLRRTLDEYASVLDALGRGAEAADLRRRTPPNGSG